MKSVLYKQEIMLIDGRRLIVKEAEESEANELISFISAVGGESNFFTFGPGEYKIRNIDERKLIRACRESDYQALIVGRVQNKIVGHLAFRSGILQRLRHIGEVGISVSKENWGIGIGTSIMNALLDWARKSKVIRKVKLRVRSDNHRAIAVYKKLGFIEEFSIIWGAYHNLVMGRSLN